jgi:cell fate regulator YaaT (PSP1 superfamily)
MAASAVKPLFEVSLQLFCKFMSASRRLLCCHSYERVLAQDKIKTLNAKPANLKNIRDI